MNQIIGDTMIKLNKKENRFRLTYCVPQKIDKLINRYGKVKEETARE